MNPGIKSLSAEDYFRADGVSRSMLESIVTETPKHFHAKHIAKTAKDEETDAMRLGSLTHRFILEPETCEGAFWVKPVGMNFATKEGKTWKLEHADLPIISQTEAAAIHGMRKAVWAEPEARIFLQGAQTEKCLFTQDGKGTLRKARLDLLPAKGNALADLKTCASASQFHMEKAIHDRGYNRQAAFTLALCELLGMPFEYWYLICVESSPPFDVVVWPMDEGAIRVGAREIEGAIQTYRNCLETGKWPGLTASLPPLKKRAISLPAWRQREMDAA